MSGLLLVLLVLPARAAPPASSALAEGRLSGGRDGRSFVGLDLSRALLELQDYGLAILFTDELVLPRMKVRVEPTASDPRTILDQLLAPHALRAEEQAGGTLVVVAADPADRSGRCQGVVRSAESGEALAGALVRLVEPRLESRSSDEGRFDVPGLEPGVYTIEVRLEGFLTEQADDVIIAGGRPTEIVLDLQPVPFVRDEIVVRPSELSLLREEPIAPLSMSRREIESLPHLGGDVFRTLSLLPGTTANDVTAQFSVHGGRRDEVQILLDGQELYDAHHLKEYDNAISIVPAEALASLSLSTGAFAAEHGDRMSGVLDMTSIDPGNQGRTRFSLSLLNILAASAGTFDGGRGGWLISARRGSIDLANRILGREDPVFWDVFGKVGMQLTDRQQLRGHVLRAADSLDHMEEVDGEEKRFDTGYDSTYLWLTHQAILGRRLLVESSVSRTQLDRDRNAAETEEEGRFLLRDRRTSDVSGLSQFWTFQQASRHALKWGLELRRYDAEYDYFNLIERDFAFYPADAEEATAAFGVAESFRGEHVAAHLIDRISPLPALTLELGLRYDRHNLTAEKLWSPRANLAWRIGRSSVLRASWGHFHQSQRAYELQVEDGERQFFSAERSQHWVLGYERLLGGGKGPLRALRLEAYRRDVSDPRPSIRRSRSRA